MTSSRPQGLFTQLSVGKGGPKENTPHLHYFDLRNDTHHFCTYCLGQNSLICLHWSEKEAGRVIYCEPGGKGKGFGTLHVSATLLPSFPSLPPPSLYHLHRHYCKTVRNAELNMPSSQTTLRIQKQVLLSVAMWSWEIMWCFLCLLFWKTE